MQLSPDTYSQFFVSVGSASYKLQEFGEERSIVLVVGTVSIRLSAVSDSVGGIKGVDWGGGSKFLKQGKRNKTLLNIFLSFTF